MKSAAKKRRLNGVLVDCVEATWHNRNISLIPGIVVTPTQNTAVMTADGIIALAVCAQPYVLRCFLFSERDERKRVRYILHAFSQKSRADTSIFMTHSGSLPVATTNNFSLHARTI